MARSLWFKLMGAFALIILVLVALVMFALVRATTGQFDLYVSQQGQGWARFLTPSLADYYSRTGSWQGVGSVLTARPEGGMGPMAGGANMSGDILALMGHRLILADASGTVVADTGDALLGLRLSQDDLAHSAPVVANGVQVGSLLVATLDATDAPVSRFRRSVSLSVLASGAVAAVIALSVGSLLFFRVTSPMRRLAQAAHGIAAGDLAQRVPVTSDDEVGEVALSFNTMAESLQRVEQQRQHMVADIAHELRTPLAVIQGNLEAMLDGILPADPEELRSIHQETLLLNRLVTDLRTLSLAEAGQLALDRQLLDLGEVAARVAERYRLRAEEQHVSVDVQTGPLSLPVLADPDRIEQVLSNLVENALRHGATESRGLLTIGTRRVPDGVEVWVADAGPGISPDELPHVFERFWRSETSRSRQTGGSGIGLALVKQLAEAHGGRVSVESEPGRGATFRIVLPAAGDRADRGPA